MAITFDPLKSEKNRRERGLPFSLVEFFDFEAAIIREDTRFAYPERRFQAIGQLRSRVVFLVFAPVPGSTRVISLRLASRKERALWLANHPRPPTTTGKLPC